MCLQCLDCKLLSLTKSSEEKFSPSWVYKAQSVLGLRRFQYLTQHCYKMNWKTGAIIYVKFVFWKIQVQNSGNLWEESGLVLFGRLQSCHRLILQLITDIGGDLIIRLTIIVSMRIANFLVLHNGVKPSKSEHFSWVGADLIDRIGRVSWASRN